mmetsp:Transcript_39793/g.77361  ORF Transcript_39793/g.77361 Transcript_39793/m.77361 type:complete len:216 (-) Transcript_39793:2907-3554(-)
MFLIVKCGHGRRDFDRHNGFGKSFLQLNAISTVIVGTHFRAKILRNVLHVLASTPSAKENRAHLQLPIQQRSEHRDAISVDTITVAHENQIGSVFLLVGLVKFVEGFRQRRAEVCSSVDERRHKTRGITQWFVKLHLDSARKNYRCQPVVGACLTDALHESFESCAKILPWTSLHGSRRIQADTEMILASAIVHFLEQFRKLFIIAVQDVPQDQL